MRLKDKQAQQELETNALLTAIQASVMSGKYPSTRELQETLQWPKHKLFLRLANLRARGISRRTTIIPSGNVVEFDTLISDIRKLKQAGVESTIIAEWCSMALFGIDTPDHNT